MSASTLLEAWDDRAFMPRLWCKVHIVRKQPFLYNLARTKLRSDYDSDIFEVLIDRIEENLKRSKNKPSFPKLETDTLFESNDKDRWVFNAETAHGVFDIIGWFDRLEGDEAIYRGLFECALSSILVPVSMYLEMGNVSHIKIIGKHKIHPEEKYITNS